MSESDPKNNPHCFICSSRAGVSIRNAVQIFNSINKLPASEKSLSSVISDVIGKHISRPTVHSYIICKKCYKLFQEYDEVECRLNEIKMELTSQFRKTLPKYSLDYDTYVGSIAKVKLEPVQEEATVSNDSVLSELPTAPAEKSPNLKINTLPAIRKISPMPPSVVIVHKGKKIAIQKTTKPPVIVKINPKIIEKPAVEEIPPSPKKVVTLNINEISPDNVVPHVQTPDFEELIPPNVTEVIKDVTNDDGDPNTDLNFVTNGEELDKNVKDDIAQNPDVIGKYVINQMGEIEESEADGIQIQEGTFLMEQDEDGSIIRVVHHPGDLIQDEDGNIIYSTEQEMEMVLPSHDEDCEEDEECDNDDYEELEHDRKGFIKLVPNSVLGKVLYKSKKEDKLTGDEKPSSGDEKDITKAYLDNPQAMVKMVGDLYECLLCHSKQKSSDYPEKREDDLTVSEANGNKSGDERVLDGDDEASASDVFTGDCKAIIQHMKMDHDEKIYICDICGDVFKKKLELSQHLDEHVMNVQGDFKCDICVKEFDSVRLLRIHRRVHHMQHKQHTCHVCNKKFGSKNLLEEHNNIHIGVRPYNCELCGKNFASKYTYQSHLKTHMDRPRPYTCAKCGKSFFTMQNLTQHEKTHLGIKDHICNVCGKAFGTQHNLEVHGVVHTGYKPYVCRTCGKAFARRAEIRDHERTHTGERPYICDLCGSTFSQRSNLQSHKRATHYDDKRYKCRACEKSFKRRRLLEYHTKASHTGERPYRCSICEATFVYPEHFKKHQRIHSGEKPYTCEVCGKAFNSRDNRNAHRFVHSDKKPYECLDCGAGFMRKPLLYAHMHAQGHLSDTIVVNQPRLGAENCDPSKYSSIGGTFILEDGQEVIIRNIKEEANCESIVQDISELGTSQQSHEDVEFVREADVFGGEMDDEMDEDNEANGGKMFVTSQMTNHIIIQGGLMTKSNSDSAGEDSEKFLEGGDNEEAEGTIIASDGDFLSQQRIQVIDGDAHQVIESEGTLRLVQIRMPNGGKGWVALD